MGSTEIGLGRVVLSSPRDQILVPNQSRQVLMLLEWTPGGWKEINRMVLPGVLDSSLIPSREDRWIIRVENGQYYEILTER